MSKKHLQGYKIESKIEYFQNIIDVHEPLPDIWMSAFMFADIRLYENFFFLFYRINNAVNV